MNADEGRQALERAASVHAPGHWRKNLYIGICEETFGVWHGDFFLGWIGAARNGDPFSFDIVEIRASYLREAARSQPTEYKEALTFIEADIRSWVIGNRNNYDLIIWWHGPEHVAREEFLKTEALLAEMCSGVIILGAPEGHQVQSGGGIGFEHKWDVSREQLGSMGYQTISIDRGSKNQKPAITAIKDCTKEMVV